MLLVLWSFTVNSVYRMTSIFGEPVCPVGEPVCPITVFGDCCVRETAMSELLTYLMTRGNSVDLGALTYCVVWGFKHLVPGTVQYPGTRYSTLVPVLDWYWLTVRWERPNLT